MSYGQTLIDKASSILGSRYQVSKAAAIAESTLSHIMAGRRPLPPPVAARLAAITGDDPREAVCAAVVDQENDPAAREELAKALHVRDWRKR